MTLDRKTTRRFRSLALRHGPDRIGIAPDPQVWTTVEGLSARPPFALGRAEREHVVATGNNRRFTSSGDGRRNRTNQRQPVDVDLLLPAANPPAALFHDTCEENLTALLRDCPTRQPHQPAPPSIDRQTAGSHPGRAPVLAVASGEMAGKFFALFLSPNEVWLTTPVPPQFLWPLEQ